MYTRACTHTRTHTRTSPPAGPPDTYTLTCKDMFLFVPMFTRRCVMGPHAPLHRAVTPGSLWMSLVKPILRLIGNTDPERSLVPSLSLLDTNLRRALPCAFPVFLPPQFHFSSSSWASPACFEGRQEGGGTGVGAHSALRSTLGWLLCCPAVFSLK